MSFAKNTQRRCVSKFDEELSLPLEPVSVSQNDAAIRGEF